jgi:hypothetical protein
MPQLGQKTSEETKIKPLFVPVCPNVCHSKTNHNRGYWEERFTNLIEQKYNGKCYFTEEEMLNGGKILCCA